ncbi:hypothetical protein K501DRAFT_252064, partial [Backusella circina FSU 941]
MPKKCCCIIPLRGGVIVSSVITMIVAIALIGATFAHKNPMVIHLSVVHTVLPWVYIGFLIAAAVISIWTLLSASMAKLSMMRLSKILFWLLVFFMTIWQAINFILSLTSRSKSTTLCNQMNPDQATDNTNSTLTLGGYSTTFLGMQYGNTYGLANCDQAVQADVVGNAIMLFVGQILLFYAATIVGSYTSKLRERKLGHRLRDLEWDDNLDELASSYRADASNAPKYPLRDMKSGKEGFLGKMSFGRK